MPQRVDIRAWRLAIRHPDGPRSMTRLVLHTLSTWGASAGDRMYPSVELISIGAGLSRETVRRALADAEREGFLIREPRSSGGQIVGYSYYAAMPDAWNPNALREWERDAQYTERRRRRRPLADGGRAPLRIGDGVPSETGSRPLAHASPSPQRDASRPLTARPDLDLGSIHDLAAARACARANGTAAAGDGDAQESESQTLARELEALGVVCRAEADRRRIELLIADYPREKLLRDVRIARGEGRKPAGPIPARYLNAIARNLPRDEDAT